MLSISTRAAVAIVAAPSLLAGIALAAQDRYSLQVPGGLAFADFRGYEDWQVVAVSHNGDKLATILGNPAMIEAFRAGSPGNGKPFPNGARMAKIHWTARTAEDQPGPPMVPGALHDVDFMVKDSSQVRRQRRMGIRPVRIRPRVRCFQARNDGGLAAAGA